MNNAIILLTELLKVQAIERAAGFQEFYFVYNLSV